MSKNIVIQEGGNNKQMTVAKLKTTQVGGGSVLWLPEDEVQLMTKSINENGTYNAENEGKYGYSVVTVNVPGGSGSADSNGKPSGTIAPGGSGSAIAGEDSNGNDVVVGVDENGKLVITPRPYSIYVVTEPTKKEYTEGETMDYTGLVVGLKSKDGTDFTDEKYPDGHIPLSELILPDVAPEGSGNDGSATITDKSGLWYPDTPTPILFTKSVNFTYFYTNGQDRWFKVVYHLTASENAWIVPFMVSSESKLAILAFADRAGETITGHGVWFFQSARQQPELDDPHWAYDSEGRVTSNINLNRSDNGIDMYKYWNSTLETYRNGYVFNGPINVFDDTEYMEGNYTRRRHSDDLWQIVTGYIAAGGVVGSTATVEAIWISPYDMRSMMTEFTIKSNVPESGGTFDTEGGGEHTSSSGGF